MTLANFKAKTTGPPTSRHAQPQARPLSKPPTKRPASRQELPLWLCRCQVCQQWIGEPYFECRDGFYRVGCPETPELQAELTWTLEHWHFCARYRGPAEGHLAPAELQAMCREA